LHHHSKSRHRRKPTRRETIFLSHATEDSQFTRWLALQLARSGYHVWCDLTNFLGGEIFWDNIETLIREGCIKFIYVLSRSSNRGQNRGFWKELALADTESKTNGIPEFIIPVAVDDLQSNEYNIYLQLRHAEQFYPGWSEGLDTLLKKLIKHKVPHRKEFTPESVTHWWRKWFRSPAFGVDQKPEACVSSWFPIEHLPPTIFIHHRGDKDNEESFAEIEWGTPVVPHHDAIVTFAPASDYISRLEPDHSIGSTEEVSVADILGRTVDNCTIDGGELKRILSWLLRASWDHWIGQQPVGIYALANDKKCAFFLKPQGQDALYARFSMPDGSESDRALTGYWTRRSKDEGGPRQKYYWHFGIQAHVRLSPEPTYRISTHVIFSDDGTKAWTSPKRMHISRRRQCKNWYNDTWRDRLLAAMKKLAAEDADSISIPVSSTENIIVSIRPELFNSPVTFTVIPKSTTADSEKDHADQEIEDETGEDLEDLEEDDDSDEDSE
jgi:hypothetical protein